MKLSNKTWTIIAIIGVVVLIYMLMGKKKDTSKMSGVSSPTPTPDDKKAESGYSKPILYVCKCTDKYSTSQKDCEDTCKTADGKSSCSCNANRPESSTSLVRGGSNKF